MADRPLFLRWLLLNAVFAVFFVVLGVTLGDKLHGVPLVSIPLILLVTAYGSGYGAWLCWRADSLNGTYAQIPKKDRIVHEARYLDHWAWVAPMLGILSSIAGMSVLISGSATAADLHSKITSGGGGIFYGTFVGVLAMLLLKHEQRMIEHALDGD